MLRQSKRNNNIRAIALRLNLFELQSADYTPPRRKSCELLHSVFLWNSVTSPTDFDFTGGNYGNNIHMDCT